MKPKAVSSKRLHTVCDQYVCASVCVCMCAMLLKSAMFSCLVGY